MPKQLRLRRSFVAIVKETSYSSSKKTIMSIRLYKDKKTGEIVPNKWVIDFYPQGRKGKQIRQVVSRVSEAQAKSIELVLRRQFSNAPMRHDPMVMDAWPDWLKSCAREYAPTTMKDIEWAGLKLLDHFGPWHLSRLNRHLFEQYMDKRRAQTWRPPIKNPDPEKKYAPGKPEGKARINTELKYFGLFLKFCIGKGYMLKLPFDPPKFHRLPKKQKVLPSLNEVDQLLSFLPRDAYLAVLLYQDAGLRRTEGLQLKGEDVLLDDGVLCVLGKGNKMRFVPISTDRLRTALKDTLEKKPIGYLMINPKTEEPYKDLSKTIKGTAERVGISKNIYNHLFRHSHTTNSLEAGMDLETIRQNLGHADIKTTQMYLHSKLKHRVKEGMKLQQYMLAAKKQ